MADWIESYLAYTDGTPTPEIFRLWSGIAAVAGALERRVWTSTSRSVLFPNLYTLLVAAPGVGKDQAINPTRELWAEAKAFKIAPVNMSKAGLIDSLAEAGKKIVQPQGIMEYHSLLVPAPEFGVLVPAHDLEFLNTLNYIYDNHRSWRERKRGVGKELEVSHPQLNILGGTQPGYLASILPEEAWTMGFTSRLIMVYASSGPQVSIFGESTAETSPESFKALANSLAQFSKLVGSVSWAPEAKAELERWARAGLDPAPSHSKLQHYTARRVLHVMKLSMVAGISRQGALGVELEDLQRARDWLLGAEQTMPDIFREMVQRSDAEVIKELHWFVWSTQMKSKTSEAPNGRAVAESAVYNFLQARLPAEKIYRVLEIAERSNIVVRVAGSNAFIAKPKHQHGLE